MMSNKKKLMIIVPTLRVGGQEKVAVTTANVLLDQYQITFVIFDKSNAVYFPNCEIVNLDLPATGSYFSKIKTVLKRRKAVKKLKKIENIDITLSFGPTANLVNVLSRGKDKIVINLRTYEAKTSKIFNIIKYFTYRISDSIICCSREIIQLLYSINSSFGKKSRLLYNPYDIEDIEDKGSIAINDYSFNESTIISVGRLDKCKNYPRLIKAFSIARKYLLKEAQLLIVGEGEERTKLENLITHLELNDSVTLIGFKENPFSYVQKSSIYVLSSYREGFPNALVEGMVFLPVVSVDCRSGPREILYKVANLGNPVDKVEIADFGIIAPDATYTDCSTDINEDDENLANAILLMMNNATLKKEMKTKARMRTYDFSIKKYKKNVTDILSDQ